VQKELDEIKNLLTQKIYILFLKKYNGNKLRFAKQVGCDEKTIRLIFDHQQGMTLNLFFKIASALEVSPSELINEFDLRNFN
jgi:DNA-binding Xre family transcriptional regulator